MANVRVLGIGVATLDIYTIQKRMYPGGNEYNVCCNAKFLGAEAGFLGVFANDKAGEILENTLVDNGIDVSFCHHEKGSSGYSIVELKEDGDRVFLFWNQEGVTDLYPIQFNDEELEYVKSFDVASIGRCADVNLEKIQYLYENGVNLCYDFHATFSSKEIQSIAPFAKYAFFSCSHLNTEQIKATLKEACDCGCEIAIGTRGSDSVLCFDGTTYFEQETCKVEHVLDALGAGDSYIGAFLTKYIEYTKNQMEHNTAVQRSLQEAAKHSASVIQIEGSIGVGYDVNPDEIHTIVNIDTLA